MVSTFPAELHRSPYAALAALRSTGDVLPGELMTLLNAGLPMSTASTQLRVSHFRS
jgi:hypothetical protein